MGYFHEIYSRKKLILKSKLKGYMIIRPKINGMRDTPSPFPNEAPAMGASLFADKYNRVSFRVKWRRLLFTYP